ncbi:hypothetical protein CRM22_010640 [Opisthorchis felineus]|uniref:EKC/KEOPS complex subunit CGI121 n=1 Tax=Opisthorchis felineus TaxID=147828 RepID=A0A4V3SBB9_OPIFE|nr:hypothetical protein CRM22_010640 [Opisthorchis felineus]
MRIPWQVRALDLFPSYSLYLGYFRDVQNAEFLRKQVLAKRLPIPPMSTCVLLDASYILDPVQVECAVTQALLHVSSNAMITHELATEVVYCLSPTRSLNQALKTFSANPSTKHFLVVVIIPVSTASSAAEPDNILAELDSTIEGKPSHNDLSPLLEGKERIFKLYGITSMELAAANSSPLPHQTIVDSILSRMSARELCRV